MENGPFIGGLPSYKMVIFYSYVKLPEGNYNGYINCVWNQIIYTDYINSRIHLSHSCYT